ncbi:MAG: hypothetical protein ACE5J3_12970, partial [Methanosarcinales archaeon]
MKKNEMLIPIVIGAVMLVIGALIGYSIAPKTMISDTKDSEMISQGMEMMSQGIGTMNQSMM